MIFGRGFDVVSNEKKETAVFLHDIPAPDPVGATLPTENSLKGRMLDVPVSPGECKLDSFESLDQLRRMINRSASLSLTLPQLSLSLSAHAGRENRVDANHIYYLLTFKSVEKTKEPAVSPDLNQAAKMILGLDKLTALQEAVQKNTTALQKATEEFNASTIARDLALTAATTATNAKEAAEKDLKDAKTAAEGAPADSVEKFLAELKLKVFQAILAAQKAREALSQAEGHLASKTAAKTQADNTLNTSKQAFDTAKAAAQGAINNDTIQRFYQRFGTHYVSRVSYGRQLFALIVLDRSEAINKSTAGGGLGLGYATAKAEVNFETELEKFKTRAVLNIHVITNGLKSVSMKNIKNMDDLQSMILEFYNPANHTPEPAIIDFELSSYSAVLLQQVPRAFVDTIAKKEREVNVLIDELLQLRTDAIRYYAYRDFYQPERNAVQEPQALDLKSDPHNRRLEYLFARLKQIIAYFNDVIEVLQDNMFVNRNQLQLPNQNLLPDPTLALLTTLRERLDEIKSELQQRACIKILALHSFSNVGGEFDVHLQLATLILDASMGIFMSATGSAANQVAAIPLPLPPGNIVAPLDGAYITAPPGNNQANQALSWDDDLDKVTVKLMQKEHGFRGREKEEEVLSVQKKHHSGPITDTFKGSSQFHLKGERPGRNLPVIPSLTARLFTQIPLNLDTLSSETQCENTRKVRLLALPNRTTMYGPASGSVEKQGGNLQLKK